MTLHSQHHCSDESSCFQYPKSLVSKVDRDKRFRNLDAELQGVYVGPIEPEEWLDAYFPDERDDVPSFSGDRKAAFKKVQPSVQRPSKKGKAKAKKAKKGNADDPTETEQQMYQPMVDAISTYVPHLKVEITGQHGDTETAAHFAGDIRPDLTLYAEDSTPRQVTDIMASELHIEMKLKETSDPFDDKNEKNSFIRASEEAQLTRGQLASYAGAQLASQFRTHCFSVWATGKSARLVRWDRGGVVFSKKFNYTEESWLVDFLWHFDHADKATRGFDESVTVAGEEDAVHVESAKKVLGLAADATVYKIKVYDEKTNTSCSYYGVNLANKTSVSPVGRCTRGFEVVDTEGRKVYLKDTWRIVADDYLKESAVYQSLEEVRNIPTVLAAGDVTGKWQKTVSHEWLSETRRANFRVHQHYFIVFKDVGIPLTQFEDTRKLVTAMRDALEAYTDAYAKGILHRDISSGNILINPDGGGLLIDWEFAKSVDQTGARIMERTGTWQFISAHLLSSTPGSVAHTLIDDLESFFHVLCYIVLVRCEHGLQQKSLQDKLRMIYDSWQHADEESVNNDEVVGGGGKKIAIRSRFMQTEGKLPKGPLQDLIAALEEVFAIRYTPPPTEEERSDYEEMVAQERPTQAGLAKWRPRVWIYDKNKELLNSDSPQWMLKLFNDALEDPRGLTGKPVSRPFLTTSHDRVQATIHAMSNRAGASNASKRKRDDEDPSEGAPRASSSKKPRH